MNIINTSHSRFIKIFKGKVSPLDPEISEINLNLLAASERIIAAEYLIDKQLFPDAVNRAYYAIFHAA